jgi:hypothetical protein
MVLRPVVEGNPDKMPPLSKQFKATVPGKYSGEDDVETFNEWLQNMARYYLITWMIGEEYDQT